MEWMAEREDLVAQLTGYLEDLRDSGVEELGYAEEYARTAPETAPSVEAAAVVAAEPLSSPQAPAAPPLPKKAAAPPFKALGNREAEIYFVMTGNGFAGEAGDLLARIMNQGMGFTRHDFCLLCLPGPIDDPEAVRVALTAQILSAAKAVVVLGEPAAQLLLRSSEAIGSLRGKFYDLQGVPLMPTLHPEELVRDPSLKRPVWEDLQQVLRLLGKNRP